MAMIREEAVALEQEQTILKEAMQHFNKATIADLTATEILCIAAKNGNIAIARKSLANGAIINPDRFIVTEDTPLELAVTNWQLDMVKFLLSNGADPNKQYGIDYPPICLLKNCMFNKYNANIIRNDFIAYEILNTLLDAGANPNCKIFTSNINNETTDPLGVYLKHQIITEINASKGIIDHASYHFSDEFFDLLVDAGANFKKAYSYFVTDIDSLIELYDQSKPASQTYDLDAANEPMWHYQHGSSEEENLKSQAELLKNSQDQMAYRRLYKEIGLRILRGIQQRRAQKLDCAFFSGQACALYRQSRDLVANCVMPTVVAATDTIRSKVFMRGFDITCAQIEQEAKAARAAEERKDARTRAVDAMAARALAAAKPKPQ